MEIFDTLGWLFGGLAVLMCIGVVLTGFGIRLPVDIAAMGGFMCMTISCVVLSSAMFWLADGPLGVRDSETVVFQVGGASIAFGLGGILMAYSSLGSPLQKAQPDGTMTVPNSALIVPAAMCLLGLTLALVASL